MFKEKRSFFEKLTGGVDLDEQEFTAPPAYEPGAKSNWLEEEPDEGQLSVDVYETANDIVIKTMVAGVKPGDLDISITREMVTIRGKREEDRTTSTNDFFHQELYWGSFARTIVLPKEIDIEAAEAIEKYGLLILKLPKLDKNRKTRLKVKGV